MNDNVIFYQLKDLPYRSEIHSFRVPCEIPWAEIEDKGDILFIIECRDGLFVVLREHIQ